MDRFYLLVDRAGRSRFQMLGWVSYGFVLLLVGGGIMAGARGEQAVRNGAGILRLAQIAFLLFAGLGRGYIGAIVNAFVLTCLAALGGGAAATMSIVSHAGLLVFFLVADYHARLFTDYPVEQPPDAGSVLVRAVVAAGALMVAVSTVFFFVPCEPYAPLVGPKAASLGVSRDQVWEIVRNLIGLMVLAGLAFWLVLRLGGGRGREGGELPPAGVSARRRTELGTVSSPPPDVAHPQGWRAQIVKLYVRLAERLSRMGVRRSPAQTPLEFARKLAPVPAAESLTDVFMRARYGDRDLTESDFSSASQASSRILDHFRGGRRS